MSTLNFATLMLIRRDKIHYMLAYKKIHATCTYEYVTNREKGGNICHK